MRRIIIIALLFAGMQLILPLGASGHGAVWLLTFGFLILAADAVGELASTVKIPKLLGYLAAGFIFGPSGLNTITAQATQELAPVNSLAIALIAFLAGSELRWSELQERLERVMKILAVELTLTLFALSGFLLLISNFIPFLQGIPIGAKIVFSVLFASIAIVHSPSATMGLLSETQARGPVARTTLSLVLVSDIIVVLIFTGALALARAVVPPSGTEAAGISLGSVVWEIVGALLVGVLLGIAVALYLKRIKRELFFFAMLVAFFGSEIARLAHVEVLLTLLTAGFVAENVSPREDGQALRHALEKSSAPIFVVFFALAGASIHLGDIGKVWFLVIPIVLVRMGSIWLGVRVGAKWGKAPKIEEDYAWMGLISQAGVAIGLATVVAAAYPNRGAQIQSIFLAVIALNETIGPILFKIALTKSGEIQNSNGRSNGEKVQDSSVTVLESDNNLVAEGGQ